LTELNTVNVFFRNSIFCHSFLTKS